MKDYQHRVIAENNELSEKITRLAAFIDEAPTAYKELPLMEKERLNLQLYLMRKYRDVLVDRIAYFSQI